MRNRLYINPIHLFNKITQIFFFCSLGIYAAGCTLTPQLNLQDFQSEGSSEMIIKGVYMGIDGQPLPFTYENEVLNFLKTAQIEGTFEIPSGITHPTGLFLAKDGVKSRAVFHDKHFESRRTTLADGQVVLFFRDTYLNDVAAYEMSRMLGMKNVPPAVLRKVDGKEGSVQLWIESTKSEKELNDEGRLPPDQSIIDLSAHDMRVFDNLINNTDRNQGNVLYDSNWNLWLIDHTRSFGRGQGLPNEKRLLKCSRPLWKKLQSLDRKRVKEKLKPYMGPLEILRIFDRRDKIVKLFKEKIRTVGEENVLFDYP
jgi:hypothetical protein